VSLIGLVVKLYAALLRLYPHAFRAAFGEEMLQVFKHTLVDAGRRSRLAATLAREFSGLLFDVGRANVLQWKGGLDAMGKLQTPSGHVLQTWTLRSLLSINFLLIGGVALLFDHFTALFSYLPHTLLYCGLWGLIFWWLWPARLPAAGRMHQGPDRTKLALLVGIVIVVFSARALTWNSRKAILIDLRQVQPGTRIEQVDLLMAGYMRSPAAPGSLSEHINVVADHPSDLALRATRPGEGTVVYRHTTDWWGNSDWAIINFENFRVVRVTFSPD
jgi:hypothetical protein